MNKEDLKLYQTIMTKYKETMVAEVKRLQREGGEK